MGYPQPEVCPRADLQARICQARRQEDRHHFQRHHREAARKVRHHLRRGSHPRDRHRWTQLQVSYN